MTWSVTLPGATAELTFAPVRADEHAELIHDWMNRSHVVPWWQLGVSLPEIRDYLAGLTHLRPWLVSAHGAPFGYVETYVVADDPLAGYYPARAGDQGFHLLVGPLSMLGTGVPRLMGRAVLAWLLNRGERAVCEPDVRNGRMLAYCDRLGLSSLGEVDLPEKRAAVLACERTAFDALWPGDRAAVAAAVEVPREAHAAPTATRGRRSRRVVGRDRVPSGAKEVSPHEPTD
ncbi:GNAT family N-acetyltransferase [Jiangella rhizosphaerae]|uniref:Lysine N-acyltransferase MbtK n=1 Tax=Jiangella rhizosphaerae TaxID=2293569 RepID=A0A418KQJ6_9ACTN|nr:GNAT family N-acetyltransferase [Jiangella rhizosphaerae]RIQ21875.1 N-acetyltransferase [Jiangella rhizosphaerae]